MPNTLPPCTIRMSAATPGRKRIVTLCVTSDCTCCEAKNSRPLTASTDAHTVDTSFHDSRLNGAPYSSTASSYRWMVIARFSRRTSDMVEAWDAEGMPGVRA